MDTQRVNPILTTKIVRSYLRHHTVGASELPDLIATVHRSLRELGRQAPVEEVLTPAVSVRQSVRHDYVVCLDCGYRGKTLRRHISSRHGLKRAEYLRRWGLQPDHPLTAPAYSEHRSTLAKQLGLGRKPKARTRLQHRYQRNPPWQMVTRKPKPQTGKSTGLLSRDGLPAPGRSLRLRMKQLHSRRNRGRGDRVLGLPRHHLSRSRHRPPMLDLSRIRFLRGKVTGAFASRLDSL
jgi:predicted transcriptional regulator